MKHLLLLAAWSLALGVAATGCAPYATYPSIEAIETRPNFEPIPTLMAEAIWYAHDTYGDGTGDFAYNLPPATTAALYDLVAARLTVGHPMQYDGAPAIHVQTVRSRGATGEVDLLIPYEDGLYQLVTVSLENQVMRGWRVVDARLWRIPRNPPPPSYVPPPVEEPAEPDAAAP